MELSVEGEECRQCDNRTLGANMWKDAGGNEQKGVTEVTKKHLTLSTLVGVQQVEERDLDDGGRYKIPKERRRG